MIDWAWVGKELEKSERGSASKKPWANPRISKCAEGCLGDARGLVIPKAVSIEKNIISFGRDSIKLSGGAILRSKSLSSYLRGAKTVSIFLVTLGKKLEKKASSLMDENDHLRGYLLDRIGSLAVESLAENFEENLRKRYASKGMSVSMRFSPGYCDWRIEEQFKLSRILDFSKAGVRLSEGCMMVPRKSISALVGIGPKGLFGKKIPQCSICETKDCAYRRVS